jgi:hypothetical protein
MDIAIARHGATPGRLGVTVERSRNSSSELRTEENSRLDHPKWLPRPVIIQLLRVEHRDKLLLSAISSSRNSGILTHLPARLTHSPALRPARGPSKHVPLRKHPR